MKANARTKKWIAYSVVAGSLAVLLVSGIMVGLYLSGNLKKDNGPLVRKTFAPIWESFYKASFIPFTSLLDLLFQRKTLLLIGGFGR